MTDARPTSLTRPLGPGSRIRFRAAACLPDRFPQVACRRCADACPTAALSARGAGPILGDGCVGCGQCQVACPTGALQVPGFPAQPPVARGAIAVDCWRVPAADSPTGALRLPCLGGLSTAALLELTAVAGDGAPELLDRGFCRECPAGGEVHPATRPLAEAHRILEAIGVPPERRPRLLSRRLPVVRMADHAGEPLMEGRLSRRALLTGGTARPKHPAGNGATAPGEMGRLGERERLFAALARLAPECPPPSYLLPRLMGSARCADHEVCASACPSGALSGYRDGEARGIVFDAAACTACGVCVRLCPGQALSLDASGGGAPRSERLTRFATRPCAQCGADHLGEDALCPACQRDRDFAQDAFASLFGSAG
jgi:Fe-S-cluster-containing hydrogenase component 2